MVDSYGVIVSCHGWFEITMSGMIAKGAVNSYDGIVKSDNGIVNCYGVRVNSYGLWFTR